MPFQPFDRPIVDGEKQLLLGPEIGVVRAPAQSDPIANVLLCRPLETAFGEGFQGAVEDTLARLGTRGTAPDKPWAQESSLLNHSIQVCIEVDPCQRYGRPRRTSLMTLRPSILLVLLISSTCAAAYAPASKAQISDAKTSGLQTVGPLPLTYRDAQARLLQRSDLSLIHI